MTNWRPRNRLGGGLPTYHYLYSGNFSNITPLPWIGAMHTAELPLLSGQHSQYRGNSSELEWDTSIAMQGKHDLPPSERCVE